MVAPRLPSRGGQKRAELLRIACNFEGTQHQARGANQKWLLKKWRKVEVAA